MKRPQPPGCAPRYAADDVPRFTGIPIAGTETMQLAALARHGFALTREGWLAWARLYALNEADLPGLFERR
jgi:hypothetical protein